MLVCFLLLYAVFAATAVEMNADVITKCKLKLDYLKDRLKSTSQVDSVKTLFCTDAVNYYTNAATWHGAIRFSEPSEMSTFDKFLDATDNAHLALFFFSVALNSTYPQHDSVTKLYINTEQNTQTLKEDIIGYAVLRQDIIKTNMNIQSLCDTASPYLLSAIEYLVKRGSWQSYSLETLQQLRDVFNRSHMPIGGFLAPAVAQWTAEYLRSIEGTKLDYFNEFLDHITVIASVQGAEVITPGMIYSLFFTKSSIADNSGRFIFAYQCSDFVRAGLLGFFWHFATEETRTQIVTNARFDSTLKSILPCEAVNFEDANWLRKFVLLHYETADQKETTQGTSKTSTFLMDMATALDPYVKTFITSLNYGPSGDAQIQATKEHKEMVDDVLKWGYVLKAPLLLDDCYMFEYVVEVVNRNSNPNSVLLLSILNHTGYFDLSNISTVNQSCYPFDSDNWAAIMKQIKLQIPKVTNVTLLYALYITTERKIHSPVAKVSISDITAYKKAVNDGHDEVMNLCLDRILKLTGFESMEDLSKSASVEFSSWIGTYLALSNAVANNSASQQQKQELAQTQESASLASSSSSTDNEAEYNSCEEDTDNDTIKFYDISNEEDAGNQTADIKDILVAPTAKEISSVEHSEAQTSPATEQFGPSNDRVSMELGADHRKDNSITLKCSKDGAALLALSAQEQQQFYAQSTDNQSRSSMHQSETAPGPKEFGYSGMPARCVPETKTSGYTLHYAVLSCICVVALLAILTAYCMTARHNTTEDGNVEDSADDAAIWFKRTRFKNWVREHTLRLRRARRRNGA